ncbi:hypothetical protein LCGC14_1482600 [marine sediment metagenome]|uniref:10 kDa chaperonin n=1 Tax=marine sediment metagenome TaxID=412755 RepID=A0A0F9JV32_9ZZZZ
MKLRPLHDYILVDQPQAKNISYGGIIIAGDQEKPLRGTVLEVGPGRFFCDKRIKPTVKVGDTVLFGKSVGEEVELDSNTTIFVLRETQILAVVE